MNPYKVLHKSAFCAITCLLILSNAYAGEKINQTIDLGGNRSVTWYVPDTTPVGWVFLQHGFQRNKSHLDDIATHFMDNGLMVLTTNSNVTGGNKSLAHSVADDLVDNPPTPPGDYPLPARMVLSGHSAGGLFVTNMAARLLQRGATDLAGLVLYDPVDANNDMQGNMAAVVASGAPVLAILANSSSCNSSNNALGPLRSLNDSFVGIRLTDDSKHFDVEGSSGGGWVTWFCGGGSKAHNIAYVQEIGLAWSTGILSGNPDPAYYPGGARINELISINDAVLIKEVTGPQPPSAEFSFSASDLAVTFSNQSSDTDGDIVSSSWTFGDGLTSVAANPSHSYNSAGTYTVTLTVTDSDGLTDSVSKPVTVTAADPDPVAPEAAFSVSTTQLTASFTDNSTDSDGVIAERFWRFGDGATSTARNPSHTYAATGTYTVELTVTDDDGETDTASRQVTVISDSDTTVLESGVPVENLSAPWRQALDFVLEVPDGAEFLTFQISGGSGDADIYVRRGTPPTTRTFDYRPYLYGNNETVNIASPASGPWYVMVRAYEAYSGVTLTATLTGAGNLNPTAKGAGVSYDTFKKLQSHDDSCVTVGAADSNNRAPVSLAPCAGGSNNNQLWALTQAGQLKSKVTPTLCLTAGINVAVDSEVFAEACENEIWHRWDYREGHLVSQMDNAMALAAPDSDGSAPRIAPVSDSSEQQWTFAGSLDKWLLILGLVLAFRARRAGRSVS
ncbi:MAG: PKD domain-containing protein [Ketobacteraceae bacterium]|nr:PKD domain-containing protein [Ketobacteraceae bacterium]